MICLHVFNFVPYEPDSSLLDQTPLHAVSIAYLSSGKSCCQSGPAACSLVRCRVVEGTVTMNSGPEKKFHNLPSTIIKNRYLHLSLLHFS